jgi:hypothetical protein
MAASQEDGEVIEV